MCGADGLLCDRNTCTIERFSSFVPNNIIGNGTGIEKGFRQSIHENRRGNMGNPANLSVASWKVLSRVVTGVVTLAFACLLNVAFTPQLHAQTYTVIHNFVSSLDGSEPTSGVTIDHAGNLYGTTFFGDQATGTAYKMTHRSGGWLLVPLYYFTNMPTGVIPSDRPIIG